MKRLKKRGNLFDIPFAGIMAFIAAIVIFISFMVMSEINDGLKESGNINQSALDIIQHQVDIYPGIWDTGWLFVLIGLGLFTWVSAFFVRSHPVFFMFGVLIIVIYIIVFGLLSNTYQDITDNPQISQFSDQFTLTNFVLTKYPIIMAIISFITAIIMYSKGEPQF